MTNLLQAIGAIVSSPIPDLVNYYKRQGKIRTNSVGDALEDVMERINNKIKLIIRQSYGFKTFDSLREKLLAFLLK